MNANAPKRSQRKSALVAVLLCLGFLASCFRPVGMNATLPAPTNETQRGDNAVSAQGLAETLVPSPSASATAPSNTPTAVAMPTATPMPSLWAAPYLPPTLRDSLKLPQGWVLAQSPPAASVRLEAGAGKPLSQWVYALVAPFPTVVDDVSSQDLLDCWRGRPSQAFDGVPLLMDETTYQVFTALWGKPFAHSVVLLPEEDLLDYAWAHRPSWAIVPFEAIQPRWKVLEVDGLSPLRKEFDPEEYALTVTFGLNGEADAVERLLAAGEAQGVKALGLPPSNRDATKLTTVVLTGVTALVRATAATMEHKGITYPAQDLGDILRNADLTHISNEIPFVEDCPPPKPYQTSLRFCSSPKYIALMEDIGTDIVELTGDHFADYGPEAMLYTLELYRQRGWLYYGGGYNLEDGRKALLIEHHGNRLALLGCNAKGGGYATASETRPGAVPCDREWMHAEIARLKAQGYLVIVTFQHVEYYTYVAQPNQIADAHGMAEAGAVIVSGSQAHQPQGMEFYGDAFIHYGLGNLFFDQYKFCPDWACNYGFVDRHVFYDGRYLGTELLTHQFVDLARPRPMTAQERTEFLNLMFAASGW